MCMYILYILVWESHHQAIRKTSTRKFCHDPFQKVKGSLVWKGHAATQTAWTMRKMEHERNLQLGGGFNYLLFSSLPGEMIQFDEHIFQRG